MLFCASPFHRRKAHFHIHSISLRPWNPNVPDRARLLIKYADERRWTAARSVLPGTENNKKKKKCWSQMSHALQQRRRENRSEMRHFDSCKRKRNSAWLRMTFGEAALHDQLRRQRQLTCALLKICEAERTGSTQGINATAQVSESLVRGLKLWFKQSLLHGNTFLRLESGLDKHFISYLVLFVRSINTEWHFTNKKMVFTLNWMILLLGLFFLLACYCASIISK